MKKQMQTGLLAGVVISFGGMLTAAAIIVFSTYLVRFNYIGDTGWKAGILTGIVILAGTIFFFIWNIYRPVLRLRDSILKLQEVHEETPVNLNVGVDSLTDSLMSLLEERKLSVEREHAEILFRQQSKYAELQNQINPHFLYNTLETIRGQAIIDDNYKIAEMTEALAKYFRYNISKDNDSVTVAQELENIQNYVQIQQYRFQDRFIFWIYLHDESGEYKSCMIPKMTLQPVVENAIFHGIEQKLEMGHISIHIETTEERLIIIVADDGGGMDKETLARINRELHDPEAVHEISGKSGHNGIALRNVNSRLKLLYGADYGLTVSSTKGLGTEVEITLPKIKSKKKQETT